VYNSESLEAVKGITNGRLFYSTYRSKRVVWRTLYLSSNMVCGAKKDNEHWRLSGPLA
jgi:hypothetical protein